MEGRKIKQKRKEGREKERKKERECGYSRRNEWPVAVAQHVYHLLMALPFHRDKNSCLNCSTSDTACAYGPGKAADGLSVWDTAPT